MNFVGNLRYRYLKTCFFYSFPMVWSLRYDYKLRLSQITSLLTTHIVIRDRFRGTFYGTIG